MLLILNNGQSKVNQNIAANKVLKFNAMPKETYQIIDPKTGKAPAHIKAMRVGDDLKLYNPDENSTVEIKDFWSDCTSINQCSVLLDLPATANSAEGWAQITQSSHILDSLQAGQVGALSADVWATIPSITNTAVASAWVMPAAIKLGAEVLGGVALGALAFSGKGSDSSSSSDTTAIIAAPDTPTSYKDNVGVVTSFANRSIVTDDNTPSLNLAVPVADGQTPVLYIDGVAVEAKYDAGVSPATLTPVESLTDGVHSLAVGLKDTTGNISAPSSAMVLTIDTTAPIASATLDSYQDNVGDVTNDTSTLAITDDLSPVLNGTLSNLQAGDVVNVYRDGSLLGTATINGSQWSYPLNLTTDVSHVYTAAVADVAGNTTPAIGSLTLALDSAVANPTATIDGYQDNVGWLTDNASTALVTDDSTPVIFGTVRNLHAGQVVTVFRNSAVLGTATIDTAGNWTYQDVLPSTPADGTALYFYSAVVTDSKAGKEYPATGDLKLSYDNVKPTATIELLGYEDNVGAKTYLRSTANTTDDNTPVIVGTVSSDFKKESEFVLVFRDGVALGTATIAADGKNWRYLDTLPLSPADGTAPHTYTAAAVDGAGNTTTHTGNLVIALNNPSIGTEATITGYNDNVGEIASNNSTLNATDDTMPVIVGTVGRLQAGETVEVYRDGVHLGTAALDPDGKHWNYTDNLPTTPNDGSVTHTYTAVVQDTIGNTRNALGELKLAYDIVAPTATVTVTGYQDNVGNVTSNNTTAATTDDIKPTIMGTVNNLKSNTERVAVFRDGDLLGTANVDPDGHWTYEDTLPPSPADGTIGHTYTAAAADFAGNTGVHSTSSVVIALKNAEIAAQATITAYNDNFGVLTRLNSTLSATDDTTPEIVGTVGNLQSGESIVVYRDGARLGNAVLDSNGTNWRYTDNLPTTPNDGSLPYTYTAVVQSTSGNTKAALGELKLAYDVIAPTATTTVTGYNDDLGPETGNNITAAITDDNTPTIVGTVSSDFKRASEYVGVFRDGNLLGTAKVDPDGVHWSYTDTLPSSPADGTDSHKYTAAVGDAAGNSAAHSTSSVVMALKNAEIATQAAVVGYNDNFGVITLNNSTYSTTDDTTPEITGTVGNLQTGEFIVVYRDGNKLTGKATVDNAGKWFYTDTLPATPNDGSEPHTYTAVVENAVGNTRLANDHIVLSLDQIAPTAIATVTGYQDDIGAITSNSSTAAQTDDSEPVIIGTVSSDINTLSERVVVFRDGEALGTATIDTKTSTWTYKDSKYPLTPADGQATHTYTAVVGDFAGNSSARNSSLVIALNTIAPIGTVTIDSYVDDAGSITGSITSNASEVMITDDTTPLLSGTVSNLQTNEVVMIYDGTTSLGTVVVNSNGYWTFSANLNDASTHDYKAVISTVLGNTVSSAKHLFIQLDNIAPTATSVVDSYQDNKGNDTNDTSTQPLTDDDTPVINGYITDAIGGNEFVNVYRDGFLLGTATVDEGSGNWTYSDTLKDNIVHTYTSRIADSAGNTGEVEKSLVFGLESADTTAPTATITMSDTALISGETAIVTIKFSEAVADFNKIDVTAENGTLGTLSTTDNITWTATFTPTVNIISPSNLVTIANTYTDTAGNTGTAASSANYTIDTTAPTATITMSDSVLISGETAIVTIKFSEAVADFNKIDVTAENGTLGTLSTTDNITWTATFTPTVNIISPSNLVTIANTYTDTAGNTGTAASSVNYTIDTTAPTATITMSDTALISGETAIVTITFSEAVADFDKIDVTAENGTLGTLSTTDNITWTATFTPTANITNPANVISLANTYTDIAGNTGTTASSENYTVDTTVPTATITMSDTALISGETAIVTIKFSEAVKDFSNIDVIAENGTLGTLTTTDNITWTATFTPTANITNPANVISLANTYTDTAGNTGTTASSENYTVDTTAPTATITMSDTALISGETAIVTIKFSEAVKDFSNIDVTVANGTLGTLTTTDNITWTATFTPTANITNPANVISLANTYTDTAGNTGTTASSENYTVDTATPPTTTDFTVSNVDTDTLNNSVISNTDNTDNITRDTLLALNGTINNVAADDILQYSTDGGITWNNAILAGIGNTTWSIADPTPHTTSGALTYSYRVINSPTNVQALTPTTIITIDVTAPINTVLMPQLATADDTGTIGDSITTKTSLSFSSITFGKGEANAVISLVRDLNNNGMYDMGIDAIVASTTVVADGAWSFTGVTVPTGTNYLGFVQNDVAGNFSRLSPTNQISIVSKDNANTLGGFNASGLTANGWTYGSSGISAGFDNNGNLIFAIRNGLVTQTSAMAGTVSTMGINPGMNSNALLDYNRDGYADCSVIATWNSATTTWDDNWVMAMYTGGSTGAYTLSTLPSGHMPHYASAVIAWDRLGTGSVGIVMGNSNGTQGTGFQENNNGTLAVDAKFGGIIDPSGNAVTSLAQDSEVSGVDIDNNGTIDLAMHTYGNNLGGNGYSLLLINNLGTGVLQESQSIDNAFVVADNYSVNAFPMLWADFNGSGYLSLYMPRSALGDNLNGRVYLNKAGYLLDGIKVGNAFDAYAAALVDWNHDGKMDIIKMSATVAAGNIELDTNTTIDPLNLSFSASNLTSNGTAITTAGAVQGLAMIDTNWDGSVDLVYTHSDAKVNTIINTNTVLDNTCLTIKISDADGINSYFGNTVKLFDSKGNTVSTQVLNAQAGVWFNDSTGLIHFYNLDPNETYSVALIRSYTDNGAMVSGDVGGMVSYDTLSSSTLSTIENYDATWGNLKPGLANTAIDLSGGTTTSTAAHRFVGTGYNDTFFAKSSTDLFVGVGGWTRPINNTASTWVATGGMDIVDFSPLTVGITATANSSQYNGIEGFRGSALADTFNAGGGVDNLFEGRAGNDTFNLAGDNHTTLAYNRMVFNAADGGNGTDTVNGFTTTALGTINTSGTYIATNASADIIDLRGLLGGYSDPATVYWDITSGQYVLDQDSVGLLKYLNISNDGTNTSIMVDANGTGALTPITTLNGVVTDLAQLLGNNQIWVGTKTAQSMIGVNGETTTNTLPIISGTLDANISMANTSKVQVVINGVTYDSLTGQQVVVDWVNHTWYVKPSTALTAGTTYDVTATVYDTMGALVGQDHTRNEIKITTPAADFSATGLISPDQSNTYSGIATGLDENGLLMFVVHNNMVTQVTTSAALVSNFSLSYIVCSAAIFDYNRDGRTDGAILLSQTSSNNVMLATAKPGGGFSSDTVTMSNSHNGAAIIAWDQHGAGNVGLYAGNSNSDDPNAGFIQNSGASGGYKLTEQGVNGLAGLKDVSGNTVTTFREETEASGVDINNSGTVDIALHVEQSNMSNNGLSLMIINNLGNGTLQQKQNIDNVFTTTGSRQTYDALPMLWADYNNTGYLSLYVPKTNGINTGAVFVNTAGTLNSTAIRVGNNWDVVVAAQLDWNHDGKIDIIKMSGDAAANVELDTNTSTDGATSFTASTLTIGGTAVQTTALVQGVSTIDVNWDGAQDIVYADNWTAMHSIINPNAVTGGTSLILRIVDQNGINCFFGNTVKLFDTTTNTLVSTQVLNQQSGLWTNDSTGILHFYNLNANHTYSAVLIRSVNGVSQDVGGQANYSDASAETLNTVENVNSTWGNLRPGLATTEYVLNAEKATDSNTGTFIGTGYNDIFFAALGSNTYSGAGGWATDATGTSVWSANVGMDKLDFTLAGSTALTVDLNNTAAQNTGWNTVTLKSIEWLSGANGNDTFSNNGGNTTLQGNGGDDQYNLGVAGGHDTLLYKALIADATGGNISSIGDKALGFKLGVYEATADADAINVKDLLVGYTAGTGAHYVTGANGPVATMDAGETIANYLTVTQSGGNTIIAIDRDGTGATYSSTTLLTLTGVSTDLVTLMANHQLIVQ